MTQSRPVQLERLIERYRHTEGVTLRRQVVNSSEALSFGVDNGKEVVIEWRRDTLYPKLRVYIPQIHLFQPYITTFTFYATLHGINGVYHDREGNMTDIPHKRHLLRFDFCDDPSHNADSSPNHLEHLGGTLNHLEHFVHSCLEIYMHRWDPVEPLEMPDRSPSHEPPDARVGQTSPASTIFTPERTRSLTPTERGRLLNVPAEGRASSMASTEPQ